MTVNVAIPLAIQVLNWVKKDAAYCGKNTLVAALRKQSKFEWGMNSYLREVLIGAYMNKWKVTNLRAGSGGLPEFMRNKRLGNVPRQRSLSDSSSSDPNTKP
jgi:hypothetical protein